MDEREKLNNFLEACSSGDIERLKTLIDKGFNINGQQEMNGWTGLHWAVKRGHTSLVRHLMNIGASNDIKNHKGETPSMLTENIEIKSILGDANAATVNGTLSFMPNYLTHPEFIHCKRKDNYTSQNELDRANKYGKMDAHELQRNSMEYDTQQTRNSNDELVLKLRVGDSSEKDFIEVEFDRLTLSFDELLETACEELMVNRSDVVKLRKLPNTIMRNDKDIRRLTNFQNLEVILKK